MNSNPIYNYEPKDIFSPPYTEMALAIRFDRSAELAKLIEAQSDINLDHPGRNGITLLSWACSHQFPKTVEILLEKGADPNLEIGKGKDTAHLVAITAGGPSEDILLLLLKFGGDPNGTVSGIPAIFQTVAARKMNRLQILLEKGADLDAINTQTDLSLVHYCAMLRLFDWVIYLLEHGADHTRKDKVGGSLAWEVQDAKGRMPAEEERILAKVVTQLEARGVSFPVTPPWEE